MNVELLSGEGESPFVCWKAFSKDEPIDYKGMVVLPASVNSVDPRETTAIKPVLGSFSLAIRSVKSDGSGKSESRFGWISRVHFHVVVWLRVSQNQRQ